VKVERLSLLLRVSAVLVVALCGGVLDAWAGTAVSFGSVNVGSSTTATVTVAFLSAGTLGSISVLTQGATGQDFTNAGGGTCATGNAYAGGSACTVIVAFTPKYSGTRYGAVQLEDGSGNVLATSYVYGTGTAPQVTFADTTQGNYGPSAQMLLGSGLDKPAGVAVDGNGNVFVAAYQSVMEILAAGGYKTVMCLKGSNCPGGSSYLFSEPFGIALDGAGNVFVADVANSALYEFPEANGYSTFTIVSPNLSLSGPTGVAVDGSGNVYVADYSVSAVKEFIGGGGAPITVGSGFYAPEGVAVDGSGDVFVADTGHNAVKEIVAVNGTIPGNNPTINTLGSGFDQPTNLVVDGHGNVFVADTGNNALKEILAAGGYTTVNTLLGIGFYSPEGVAVDGIGNVFVGDTGSNAVYSLDFVDSPSLTFNSTNIGSTSSDSPQTITLSNIGYAALSLPVPLAGDNPSIATNFTLNSSGGTACPLVSTTSSTAGALAAGASCQLSISFEPTAAGALTGSLVLTDSNLNATGPGYTTQSITLNGTGIGKITPAVSVTPSLSSITTAQALTVTAVVSGGNGNPTPTGSVTLTSGSYSSAASTLNGGSAQINVPAGSLSPGNDVLTVTYTPDSSSSSIYNSATGSSSVAVTAAVSPSFTVSGTAVTVPPGATTANTSTITVTPAAGFTGSVTLTAAVTSSPTGAQYPPTFSFGSTSPVSIIGTSAGTATLTITTTAATSAALVLPKHNGVPWYAAGGAALACILLFGIPARRRSWRTMLGTLVFLVALSGGVLACGGGGSGGGGGGGTGNPGTTAGTYTVTVTGTSGTTTATGTVALTVQ